MATYYVRKTGNDGNAGTSAGAAWLTIGKALGAAGIASGDTVYIGPGIYREAVACNLTSPTAETKVIGDVDGSHTGDAPGPVVWTAWTTNDTTAPAASILLNLNGRDFLTFQNLIMFGGNANPSAVQAQTTLAHDIKFTECFITGDKSNTMVVDNIAFGNQLNWTIDRCTIRGSLVFYGASGSGSNYDIGITIQNSWIHADGIGIAFNGVGAGAQKPGGAKVLGCLLTGGTWTVYAQSSVWDTANKIKVYNCLMDSGNGVVSDAANQMDEDYNYIFTGGTARSNVTAGANSQAGAGPAYAPNFAMGNEYLWGQRVRPPWTPLDGSPLLGFGNGTGVPAVDVLNRPRPAGGPLTKAVGYVERHDTAAKETGTTQAGGVGIVITGPGDHEFDIPVDAVSTSISIYGRYDTNHAATNKPQMQLVANNEIGFAGETKTMTVTTDTWEQITFTAFTPSAKGIVRLRLISRAAAATGKAFFDTVAVA